ncbi:hypothetical protein HX786_11435 [Pseudomonas sp. 21615526]|uniref:hypothetical protein n=1 Tax=Pseudomonas sp. 21615526 TaxID=2738811 RepID=UPI0015B9A6D0|nr:hypothetical protein [Pseudomonas sp. 21615526]NVZ38690.1 hypothetical protein [Pseudomonas sp. 21615526]
MSSAYYLPRKLTANEKIYTQEELLLASDYIVVLSEPGGGKSSLLESIAQRLGVACVTANVFRHLGSEEKNTSLVIDAFDELAKIDQSGIHRLFANAKKSEAKLVVISSRSSEWGASSTQAFADFMGQSPLVVRLCEFDKNEQKAIFDKHVPGEDFKVFEDEVSRFDLDSLLPNPQFLKLFADAYVESGRHFVNKRSIFSLAVERLSRETNPKIASGPNSLSITEKVSFASEIFAKLLLSGADGVTKSEANESRVYPFMGSLSARYNKYADVIATRLFKPGDYSDQHRPVHKVVVEYCAAGYLVGRIGAAADSLTLTKCLPIIAPNTIVRDELRGLVGWMAALGNRDIQIAAIQLDPYAVLANGDPSSLESSSKHLLIRKLKEIESIDPYFRRGDFGRSFSAAGFFTKDVIEEVRPVLVLGNEGHLRDLILELLINSKEARQVESELVDILLSTSESESARLLASRCLLAIEGRDSKTDLIALYAEATHASLRVAAEIIKGSWMPPYGRADILEFLRVCAELYPKKYDPNDRVVESRYFIKRLIGSLDLETSEWLLDNLYLDLVCICGKAVYECGCKTGTSKIIGSLLDRYFGVVAPPYDPVKIWKWVENLNYYNQIGASQSKSVEIMQDDVELRQGIMSHALGKLADCEEIINTKIHKFDFHSHSGLVLCRRDMRCLADFAFESNNPVLWSTCIPFHRKHLSSDARGSDDLRKHLRNQALMKPAFMREWSKVKRQMSESDQRYGLPANFRRKLRKGRQKQKIIREKNAQYLKDNRQIIESGSHWRWLVRFSDLALTHSGQIESELGDERIARNALRNCIGFIAPKIPSLTDAATLSYTSSGSLAVRVLYAACLEIMREKHSLEGVELRLLKVLRGSINVHYSSVSKEQNNALKTEIDRLIFAEEGSAEEFIRDYVESQLAFPELKNPDVWLLYGDEAFSKLRSTLSIEWLSRFEGLKLDTVNTLFDIAAQGENQRALKAIIEQRCAALLPLNSEEECCLDLTQSRLFWFVSAFYFLDDISQPQWDWLRTEADNIFAFHEHSSSHRLNHTQWPALTALKVKAVLDAFVDYWPSVELPSNWGSDSPKEEKAYRFIRNLVWSLNTIEAEQAIPVVADLLEDFRYEAMHKDLASIYSAQLRVRSLKNYQAPLPADVVSLLEADAVVTVEGLRQLIIDELQLLQDAIDGGEFNPGDRFYEKEERVGEIKCTEIIAERLSIRLGFKDIVVMQEHYLKGGKRSDFTVTKLVGGKRKLLVAEVKGQWHSELYCAAQGQLYERYSIHPDAENQGIYLVLWFGGGELIAGRRNKDITSAQDLKFSIEASLPQTLKGLLDVFVLDLSKP